MCCRCAADFAVVKCDTCTFGPGELLCSECDMQQHNRAHVHQRRQFGTSSTYSSLAPMQFLKPRGSSYEIVGEQRASHHACCWPMYTFNIKTLLSIPSDLILCTAEKPLGFDVPPVEPGCKCGSTYELLGPDLRKRVIVIHSTGKHSQYVGA